MRAQTRALPPGGNEAAGWDDPRGAGPDMLTWVRAVDAPAARVPAVPRLLLEIVFLVAVAVAAAIAELEAIEIVGVMVAAWLLVAIAELVAARAAAPTCRDGVRAAARVGARLPDRPVLVRTVGRASRSRRRRSRRRDAAEIAAAQRRLTDCATGALPDRYLRDLLPDRAPALVAAHATRRALAPVHHRRELRLLQRLGLALRLPARGVDRLEPALRARDPPTEGPAGAKDAAHGRGRRQRRVARLLQVLRLLRDVDEQPLRVRRRRRPARGALDRPPGRHLLLHVHGDQLRRRRLPRRLPADVVLEVRGVPVVLPASRRRADRPPERAHPAARDAARSALRRHGRARSSSSARACS